MRKFLYYMSFNTKLTMARRSSTWNEDKRQVVDKNGGKRKTKQSEEWVKQPLVRQNFGGKMNDTFTDGFKLLI